MKKNIWKILKILAVLYIAICVLLYFLQEKLIFFPEKLDPQYRFSFDQNFKELNIITKDSKKLNGLLFTTDSSKGLIFYLHGNAGALNSWGDVAKTYTSLKYDVFMLDYRGYGKSEGSINGQEQIFKDVQTAYDTIKHLYKEDKIIVLGYSIGTGPAAKLASTNGPELLILQAPYYSLTDMMRHTYPLIPTLILKYKFDTDEYITGCKMPVVIFHGDADEVIYYGSSVKLKTKFKQQDTLITLAGQGHNGITENPDYILHLQKILAQQK
ncbi:alpha/beta hydrolase [Ferruginibacter sp. SUN106]|uniref:alpha/beta hydrolase n=1 Tax=Ferruginibacter sp. SUN106 TaxID=2978348 RepID=UPI003D36D984